jgi:hypothetical protein
MNNEYFNLFFSHGSFAFLIGVVIIGILGALHTMAEGREAVDFHQSNCKNPRVQPLDPSHYGQSPKAVTIKIDYFLKKATDSRRKFGSDGNGNPNYGREVVGFFSLKIQSLTRSWPLDWRGYFEQGTKWHAPLGLDFGLGLWRLHTMPGQRLDVLYFIGYFQLISLDSQQSLATQSHGLSIWTAIVGSGS